MTREEKERGLESIALEIGRCSACKRNKIGRAVSGEGDPDAEVVFIGEAPGKEEAKTGRPFIGRAGKVLRALIAQVGLDAEDVYITSPVKYLPKHVTPDGAEIAHGKIHLDAQLAIIEPKIIVCLGVVACKAVLGRKMIPGKEHGTLLEQDGRKYFLTYHPAAPLHSPSTRPKLVADFKKLKGLLKNGIN